MSENPETLRLYAKIMERPRMGDVPPNKRASHAQLFAPGEIAMAAAKALRFQADAIERTNHAVADLSRCETCGGNCGQCGRS